ncbi:type I-E CRISPR-associated protein Cas6/Cse3/CasE [Catenulispora rubra]|uniref:type I-E CRISPR-associated protein Cas6/Cse3/CasE n=1 Tax=Catenulispora rubra TaxID=280293 RepID=UPI00189214F5|nr:type I-E CRISPR-associated protein Cas6/Cse3/CasE [Catenulispora rubra]
MPYLSKILINPRRRDGQALLSNPHVAHGMIMAGLPDPAADRPLWRIDADNPARPQLLALTGSRPDWTHITEQAGWPDSDAEQVVVRDYAPLLDRLENGRRYAFRLTASPTQSLKNPLKPSAAQKAVAEAQNGRHRGHRVAHRTLAQQLGWFLQRTERWGFTIAETEVGSSIAATETGPSPSEAPETPRNIRIASREIRRFQKTAGGPTITVSVATFEGVLVVTDAESLRATLTAGIGPAKAYGCGLLTLAPVT